MGMRRVVAAAVLLLMGALAPHAIASTVPAVTVPDDEAAVQAVTAAKEVAYRDALERMRILQAASPEDVEPVIAQCRFISNYLDDEYGDWIEVASEDHQACLDVLATRWKDAPAAKLHVYRQQWGDDAIEVGEALLKEAGAWPDALRRELYAAQAVLYANDDRDIQAGKLALQAARLGDTDSVPMAVGALLRQQDEAGAARLLRETPVATLDWRANRRLDAAMRLQDPSVALAELRRHERSDLVLDSATVARVHLRVGDAAAATRALGASGTGRRDAQVRFDTALMAADVPAAIAQIRVAEMDDMAANLQRFAVLAGQFPTSLLSLPMVGMALVSSGILLCLALLPVLLLMPVHYRGLARRVQGRVPAPVFPRTGLLHAWWGLALMLALPFLVAGVVAPDSLAALFTGEQVPDADALFRLTLWSTIACLVLLVPAVRALGPGAFRGEGSWRGQAGWLLLGLVVVYAVAFLQGAWLWGMEDSSTVQTETVGRLLEGGKSGYGPLLTLLLMAVLVPVFEELVFRGLLLGGLARHISFGWANTIQALLFALIHNDFPRFLFYFAMGLVTGLLVRRTRSVTPAIALHAINNAAFFLVMS
ncbi:membrane protease YdiL (CAAX protease family) [Pseudoxanthomonas japonensis]|uniref:CPBP family intramembrane glutamic endopeptidase n=1 Tax=Pseudoxanthomonas japonensis TaxID=69284 RepID=UPI00285DE4D0|nr:type II CAAX endopeptidase family protein [Pseudoxanthomonas japonensis]MDR7067202.1 membrane protease YdiL (CAAX protease family) [Pseudoxanthomonas japonensis]